MQCILADIAHFFLGYCTVTKPGEIQLFDYVTPTFYRNVVCATFLPPTNSLLAGPRNFCNAHTEALVSEDAPPPPPKPLPCTRSGFPFNFSSTIKKSDRVRQLLIRYEIGPSIRLK